jgi:pimeloyl-ACP methyl ester carboxylesterase
VRGAISMSSAISTSRIFWPKKAPVLVMHVRGDVVCPFDAGRQLAAGIPGAHFIAFPGRNHLFLEHAPACDRFFEEISLFLKGRPGAAQCRRT